MAFYFYSIVFVFGAVVGSFLNVAVLRHNTGRAISGWRSKCFSCGKMLKWFELIPVLSFLWQKGRCRKCKSKISKQYPATEILTGSAFLLIFSSQSADNLSIVNKFSTNLQDGQTLFFLNLFFWLAIASLLIAIAVYDYRHQIIPNFFVWLFNGLAFLGLFVLNFNNSDFFGNWSAGWRMIIGNLNWNNLSAGFVLFSFFAILWLASRGRWMGFGDAKLALGIGWLLGLKIGALAIVFSFWTGAIVGIFLLFAAKKRYNIKSSIAFGPFMVLGTFISFFWGEKIINLLF